MVVPSEGASSSSSIEMGDCACADRFVEALAPDLIELVSLLSAPSKEAKAAPLARGLSVLSSVELLLILLRIDDLIDRDVLSFVSDRENGTPRSRESDEVRFVVELDFFGVEFPDDWLFPILCLLYPQSVAGELW